MLEQAIEIFVGFRQFEKGCAQVDRQRNPAIQLRIRGDHAEYRAVYIQRHTEAGRHWNERRRRHHLIVFTTRANEHFALYRDTVITNRQLSDEEKLVGFQHLLEPAAPLHLALRQVEIGRNLLLDGERPPVDGLRKAVVDPCQYLGDLVVALQVADAGDQSCAGQFRKVADLLSELLEQRVDEFAGCIAVGLTEKCELVLVETRQVAGAVPGVFLA